MDSKEPSKEITAMDRRADTYDGEIVAVLRSQCIGYQRDQDELISVIESLVQPKEGPPTIIYQIQRRDGSRGVLLRSRPMIDIPAPDPANW